MGYRAQVITQHREYGATVFADFGKFETYKNFLYDNYPTLADTIYEKEGEDYFEIPKTLIEKEIERLEKMHPEAIEESLGEEAKYVVANLRAMLEESVEDDDFVALEWY